MYICCRTYISSINQYNMHIIQNYIHNLMENLPKKKEPENINLILDGGIFNGSYLIGALYFLKEMEKQKYVAIHKISCCSISSVCALLYQIDALDLMTELYDIILKQFKDHCNLDAFEKCFDKIRKRIENPAELLQKLNNRFYITYYNIVKGKKIVKCKYRNIDQLFETIYKSCFVPFVANGNIVYKNRFCDGINPHILPEEPTRKILYLDLFGSDKINYLLSVKNEKTNFHSILAGLLDIHLFYIKQNGTQMCSYTNQWSIMQLFRNRVLKVCIEKVIFYVVYFTYYLKHYIPSGFCEHIIFKIISKIIKDLYVVLIENYCF